MNEPAFPRTGNEKMMHDHSQDGMTLRDYFAARALQGMVGNSSKVNNKFVEAISYWSFQFADAMMKQRESK